MHLKLNSYLERQADIGRFRRSLLSPAEQAGLILLPEFPLTDIKPGVFSCFCFLEGLYSFEFA